MLQFAPVQISSKKKKEKKINNARMQRMKEKDDCATICSISLCCGRFQVVWVRLGKSLWNIQLIIGD